LSILKPKILFLVLWWWYWHQVSLSKQSHFQCYTK
jgi:hypothetical protein